MENLTNKTIGQIVSEDYRTASVFESNKIDFCCKGGRTLEEACQKGRISIAPLIEELNKVMSQPISGRMRATTWPVDLLADYIEKKHHRYVTAKIPEITAYLDKICKVHGKNHPEYLEIRRLFIESGQELTLHMHKEEHILFPFIRILAEAEIENRSEIDRPPFGTVANPIKMMMEEHNAEGDRFEEIVKLSNDYTPPADACNTCKVTFSLLKEFETDLHQHIHLENNILFPRAMELENKIYHA